MTTATALTALSERAASTAAARSATAPAMAVAPSKYTAVDRQTKVLAAVTGACALIVLVFFLAMIALLGANGRTQRAYSADHPVAPVTRLAK